MAFWNKKDGAAGQVGNAAVNGVLAAKVADTTRGAAADPGARKLSIPTIEPVGKPAPILAPATFGTSATSPQTPTNPPSQSEIERMVAASQRVFLSFGQIMSVLARSPQFRTMPLGEIEGLVGPAISSGQILIAEALVNGTVSPAAVALWASVSPEVDQRLSQNLDQPFRIEAKDWRSGDIPWIILLEGDGRAINGLLKQFQDGHLKGGAPKMRVKSPDGKIGVSTLTAAAAEV